MALPDIKASDFTGWVNIVANAFKQEKLDEYIELFGNKMLRDILGDAAFIDISAQSRNKWEDLLNGVVYVNLEGKRKIHDGLVKPLTYFIYFYFARDNFTSTQIGIVKGESEGSRRVSDLENLNIARTRYNLGVNQVNSSLPMFLEANAELTTTVISSTDRGDLTYLLEVDSTKYLIDGDTVNIGSSVYEVSEVVEGVTIVVTSTILGLDFTDALVFWEPFKEVEFCALELAGL